jgi:hypothetical protein
MIPLDYPRDGSERAEIVLFLVTDRGKWITSRRSTLTAARSGATSRDAVSARP